MFEPLIIWYQRTFHSFSYVDISTLNEKLNDARLRQRVYLTRFETAALKAGEARIQRPEKLFRIVQLKH